MQPKLSGALLDQVKAFLIAQVKNLVGSNLAAWFVLLLTHVTVPAPAGLVVTGSDGKAEAAPADVKAALLALIQGALAKINRPLVRLLLTSLVNNVLPGLIDQIYDGITSGTANKLGTHMPNAATACHLDLLCQCDAAVPFTAA